MPKSKSKRNNPDYNNLLVQIRLKVKRLEQIAISLNWDLNETLTSSKMKSSNIELSENELLEILQTLNQIEIVFIRINNKFVELKKGY